MTGLKFTDIVDVRAFEKEFQSSPQGETPSLTTSAVPASDEAMTKGGEAPASPPDPESIASYYASIWGLSNHKLNQLTNSLRKWREQIEAASPVSKRVERLETATHRHVKRGSEYVLIGYGKMQSEDWTKPGKNANASGGHYAPVDMHEVAIYRSVDDGSLWVRPREDFEDGRFQALQGGRS